MKRFAIRPLLAAILASFAASVPAAIDVGGFDLSIDPCADLYQHVNRNWIESTEIPADRFAWGTGAIVDQRNERLLLEALDEALAQPLPAAGTTKRKVLQFYASGMDTAAIDKAGLGPLEPHFDRIAATHDADGLAATLGALHIQGIGAGFDFEVRQDAKQSTRYLAEVSQGGLGLPERDYYFKDDERTKSLREGYRKHVARMFELAGDKPEDAERNAGTVFALETDLARASMNAVERRDVDKTYNKMTVAQLAKDAPGFPWPAYFKALGLENVSEVNVAQPAFFQAFAKLAADRPAADWQTYLRWHLLHDAATKLPAAFAQAHFDFYDAQLQGVKTPPPRARHVLVTISGRYGSMPMGQGVGEIFVEKAFPPEAKARALDLVKNVKAALRERLQTVDWMSEQTRSRALEKLAAMQIKIGYPDAPRDYADADVGPYSFVENWMRANAFEHRRTTRRLGGPIDRGEWWMSPHIVNAYYNARGNEIVFPAAILQPPYFDAKADDALNYGAIGMVIGHEITHGFDDRGRRFDAQGNLRDWWTEEDAKRYVERARKVERQYSGFEGVEGTKVNGKLTLGENISDVGGLKIAYLALQKALKDKPRDTLDGYTPEQRFFLSYAQQWRNRSRIERERLLLATDGHSPPRYRVSGVIAHMPEFARAFSCDANRTLLSEGDRANIW
ncbi:MAG: M13 family metallopeptidase [Usitatibacter sp.]